MQSGGKVRNVIRAAGGLGALIYAATLTFATPAAAQRYNAAARIDQYQPASAGSPFGRAEGPVEQFTDGVSFAARIIGDYALDPLRTRIVGGTGAFDSDKSPVKHAILLHAGGQISPVYWLNFELDMPFAVFENGTADTSIPSEQVPAGTLGVGDLRLGAHVRPYVSRVFSFQLGARFWAPTGQPAAYLSTQERPFRVEAVLAGSGRVSTFFLYGCTLGVAPLWFAGRDGDRLGASCAVGFEPTSFMQVAVEPHVAMFTFAPTPAEHPFGGLSSAAFATQFETMGSLSFHAGDFWVALAGGSGAGGAPGTPTARGILSLTYAARGRHVQSARSDDTDLDGTPDIDDACPREAGPKERRGCPESRDRDGDGIPDSSDACPDKPGVQNPDALANGCPDSDNDHFPDPIDECPNEPGQGDNDCPKFARLKEKAFVVTPPIVFPPQSDRLGEQGTAALVEIVRTTRANPKISHLLIRLGTRGSSTRLTDLRAKSILAVLSDQNLETSRFELSLADDLPSGTVQVTVAR